MNTKKLSLISFSIVLVLCFSFSPDVSLTAEAAFQNPSRQEISNLFEEVGQEKKIPPVILKAIAYAESGWRQWDSKGNVITAKWGSVPNIGIMQVGSYDPANTDLVNKLKNDIKFNISYGADLLLTKWEAVPRIGDGDRNKLENWYFAIWAYNGWTVSNNPNNAAAAGRIAYQDKILQLIGTEYYKGLVHPIKVTPIPPGLIPAGTLPLKKTVWDTPQPSHEGGLKTSLSSQEKELIQSVSRIAGNDRIGTAASIALNGWPNGCETVLIARSDDFPDALAGAALAVKYNAPVLLTSKDRLDTNVEQVLATLKPHKIIILGGHNALEDQVEKKIREIINWTEDISRIAGRDRFETAALIAAHFPEESPVAVATGHNYPDALSLAAAAGVQGYPLLLVSEDHLPQVTKDYLNNMLPQSLYIAGGENVISSSCLQEISEASGLLPEKIRRFAGHDRYETSTLIIEEFHPSITKLFLATGQDFPDALAGAAYAGHQKNPMLLIPPPEYFANSSTEKYVQKLPQEVELEVFGGKDVLPDESILQIKLLI